MKVGDLVQRTRPVKGVKHTLGVVVGPFFEGLVAAQVTVCWSNGAMTAPLKRNLEVISECR